MNGTKNKKTDACRAKEIFTKFLKLCSIDYVEEEDWIEFERVNRRMAIFRDNDVILCDDNNNTLFKGSVFEIIHHLSGSIDVFV